MPPSIPTQSRPVSGREVEQFFKGVSSRMNLASRATKRPINKNELDQFFVTAARHLATSEKVRMRRDRKLASGFNVFHFIEPDENRLSDVLAFLLDPKEVHGQGDLFLRVIFEQLGMAVDFEHTRKATVQREATTHNILNCRRRMDILVHAGHWLAIENKVDSPEQPEQVKDYLEHLHHYTRRSLVRAALIYLSPNGRPPDSVGKPLLGELRASKKLFCWSYHLELRQWLERCQRECAAPKIRSFLSDLMAYLETHFQRETVNTPEEEDYEE